MTVKELRELLEKEPDDAKVMIVEPYHKESYELDWVHEAKHSDGKCVLLGGEP